MNKNELKTNRCSENEMNSQKELVNGREISNNAMEKKEKELLLKEISLLKRERELLLRENKFLNQTPPITATTCETEVSFGTLKELLPSYNGGAEFNIWFTQLNSIKNTYKVSEKNMRALICSKLEGNAKAWLYSKPYFLDITVEDLMKQMKDMFDIKPNRITSRRNFEDRKWKYGEKFMDYYNAKVILSNDLCLQDDELLEYLVEGISSPQLRT